MLKDKAGINGGETEQRFYMKFPIYRPRQKAPDVSDDIKKIWEEQLSMTQDSRRPKYLLDSNATKRNNYFNSTITPKHNRNNSANET